MFVIYEAINLAVMLLFIRTERMAMSVSSIESTMTQQDDDFDDFHLPDLSVHL